MRDKLIELIKEYVPRPKADALVIHLLANGVIVPPCKVGDTIADVVEVKRGEWVSYQTNDTYGFEDVDTWYKCSECGKDALGRCLDDWYSSPIKTPYRPNCGAIMEGGAE